MQAATFAAPRIYATVIDNPIVNDRAGAILIVTPNFGANNAGVTPPRDPMGVYYDATGQCGFGAGHWVIYDLAVSAPALMNNQRFNVLAVYP